MTRRMTRVRLTHRRGGDTIGAKQECPDRWSSCAHGLTPSEAFQVMNRIWLATLFEWTNLEGKPQFASVKTDLAQWLPKTDAPNLSPKTKRKKERKAE